MVDAERLSRLLARVSADVADLRDTAGHGDLSADPVRLRAIKYGFVTAIEGCTRAAQHVISSEGLGMPQSNADSVRLLGSNGIVEPAVAEAVARAVGFRNVLVHEYAQVDDSIVVTNLNLLADLDALVAQLARWAARQ
ncbi:MAG: DUF86 domain-containing protein [Geodermatophilaceae bacterium]|nr:DUF86 domain-containing protein [Geodermatophilaceae bacterium]